MAVADQSLRFEAKGASVERPRGLAGRRLTAGVRPEALTIARQPGAEDSLRAEVEHTEELGHETLVTVRAGSAEGAVRLIVRLPATHEIGKGMPIELEIAIDDVHLFGEDGQALSGTARGA
jgi:ABC-type sugar transport system ATPase subunit